MPFATLIPQVFKHPTSETINGVFLYIHAVVRQIKIPMNPTMPKTIPTGVIGLGGGGTGPGGIDQQKKS